MVFNYPLRLGDFRPKDDIMFSDAMKWPLALQEEWIGEPLRQFLKQVRGELNLALNQRQTLNGKVRKLAGFL